jgi:hypothetical protein
VLRTQSVENSLWNLLKDLQGKEILKDYFLVGGTALSLQLGHRMSYDIDLFTRSDINKDEIFDMLNRDYNGNYQIHNVQNTILQIIINDIKVDFVKYDYTLIEDVKSEDGIKYLGIKDISAMKLKAIANRGDQAKDFFDIYYLLSEISLSDMFEYYKRKYNQKDVCVIKRSLVYFDDVTESNWASVRLLTGAVSAGEVKRRIINEVDGYNRSSGRAR